MKTFDEVKADIVSFNSKLISQYQEKIVQSGVSDFDKNVANKVIQTAQNNIDNIDEVTTIKIGSEVNSLIKYIQYGYSREGSEYHNQFDKFMEKWVLGEYDREGNKKPGPAAVDYVYSLGITGEDLQCLKGTIPIKREFGDELRQRVNAVMGTKIPMSGVEENALKEWENATDETKEQAFVTLKEVQRDSGSLRSGNTFYTLANNQMYQEAKSHISGRTI